MTRDDSAIRKLRQKRGTLRAAARAVGATASAIGYWEAMKSEPKPRYRVAFAKYLGISVGQLGWHYYRASVKPGPNRAQGETP